jgi:5-hydroxyisourate hydrolase
MSGSATAPPHDPITTHVLDSTTGLPAPSVPVSLTLLNPLGPSKPFTALTSADGRINTWTPQAGPSLSEIFANLGEHSNAKMVWSLKFDTKAYWGEGKTFYPEVEVKFFVGGDETGAGAGHWHVPVLLGPWGYTTYRGS